MITLLSSLLERHWLAVTFAEAGEPEQARLLLDGPVAARENTDRDAPVITPRDGQPVALPT
ncbi:MAG: hypothetical protein HQM01_01840 [Magnetococcales bacterium]|nr:hypothetical protein [Magnetococcales bacterium]